METISQDFPDIGFISEAYRKHDFLGFLLNLDGYSLFVNHFI